MFLRNLTIPCLALAGMILASAGNAAAQGPENCTTISSEVLPVSICLDPDGWALANLDGAEEHGFRRKDHDMFVLMITETDAFDLDTLKKAILTNAQTAAGLHKIKTLEDDRVSIGDKEFGRIVYKAHVNDLDVTYANYYTSFDNKGSLQIVAFAAAEEFDSIRPIIDEVIESIDIAE